MHTTVIKVKDTQIVGGEVIIHCNGDWSGDAIITWRGLSHGRVLEREVRLPGQLLVAIGKEVAIGAIRNVVISALEDL